MWNRLGSRCLEHPKGPVWAAAAEHGQRLAGPKPAASPARPCKPQVKPGPANLRLNQPCKKLVRPIQAHWKKIKKSLCAAEL